MRQLNIPSYNSLIPRDRRIKSIQELYEAIVEVQSEEGEIPGLITRVEALESLVSEGDNPTLAIDKINEIISFLAGYNNTDTLSNLLTQLSNSISGKQDALTFETAPSSSNKVATMADMPTTMGASGSGHKGGLVPDTPSTAGTTKFLREDGQWEAPPAAPVTSVNGQTGAVVLSIPDVSTKEDVTTIEAPVDQTDPTDPITTLSCQLGKYYRIDVPVETLAVTLPAMGVVTSVKTITIYLTGGTTPAVTITSADSKSVVLQDGYEIKSGKTYEVNCLYNGAAWVIGALTINTGE